MKLNYPSNSEVIRNIADVKGDHELIGDVGPFRIVRFDPPYLNGAEFWVLNEKGFLWEPADSLDAALEYLDSEEAQEYIRTTA
jgi:hypothetical protein